MYANGAQSRTAVAVIDIPDTRTTPASAHRQPTARLDLSAGANSPTIAKSRK
jgi:hypothetical protein